MGYTREQMREYMRTYRAERMSRARAMLGGKCSHCGKKRGLQFDHVDPSSKVAAVTKLLHASSAEFDAEVAKCQLLCAACHQAKGENAGEVSRRQPHSLTAYKKGRCRCDICRGLNAERMKRNRELYGRRG
jgi:5-methylcytosine-specific restriction endonuclease McrA